MRTVRTGDEITINLTLEDKLNIDVFGNVSSVIEQYQNPQVTLHVSAVVHERGGFQEERGFRIEATPALGSPRERTRYDIFISEELFKKIVGSAKDRTQFACSGELITDGKFLSRSRYGRVDITYYPEMPIGGQYVLKFRK